MFFVFNKRKINSYIISFGMVAILFTVSAITTNNLKTVDTSTNIVQNLISNETTENIVE